METVYKPAKNVVVQKIIDYAQLTKMRLTLLVVFSAVIGFLFGVNGVYSITSVFFVALGGLLVTSSSIIVNQILERDIDKLMARTQSRPLPSERMSLLEAVFAAGIFGIAGILLLWHQFNAIAGVLAAISLLSYGFLYTPLKRIHSIAVFVGAIPGALPTTIGYVCATGKIDFIAVLLFVIQFLWQFPHFWAIAWVQYDDYKKAGIMLLPSSGGKNKFSAFQTMLYTFTLLLVSIFPYYLGIVGIVGSIVIIITGTIFLWQSIQLWIKCDDASARKLMFGSFLYLPVVQLAMLIDKTNLIK
ncbi:MAG: heme o synthase [Chitinophagales bacterium]|nr:heme o synthase [Chitinophagales bacterium]